MKNKLALHVCTDKKAVIVLDAGIATEEDRKAIYATLKTNYKCCRKKNL
jgi:hypothetical protein